MRGEINENQKSAIKKMSKVEKLTNNQLGKLEKQINGHYMSEKETKDYVEEFILTETDKLNRKYQNVTN